jgi:major membrane immunogen (membrane-anchored lipoprotein)
MKKEIKSIFDKMNRYRCCTVSATQGDLTKIECPYREKDNKKKEVKANIKKVMKSVETNRLCSIHIDEDTE